MCFDRCDSTKFLLISILLFRIFITAILRYFEFLKSLLWLMLQLYVHETFIPTPYEILLYHKIDYVKSLLT